MSRKLSKDEVIIPHELDKPIDFKLPSIKFKSEKQFELHKALIHDALKIGFIEGCAGTGKAQPIDAKVLTPNGWAKFGDLNIGDYVIGKNGLPTKILNIFPQGKKQVYSVKLEDGSSAQCCDEHLWLTQTYEDKHYRVRVPGYREQNLHVKKERQGTVKSLSEIRNTLTIPCRDGSIRLNHYLPFAEPVEFEAKKFFIHPYLLGLLIGDGSLTAHVGFSSADTYLVELASKLLHKDYMFVYRSHYDYSIVRKKKISGQPNLYKEELKRLGLHGKKSEHKFIPLEYMLGSKQQRIHLLQGLMDTDGTTSKNAASYSTSSPQLAKDFRQLVFSLESTCTVSEETTTHLNSFRILLKLNPNIAPFRLPRKKSIFIPKTKYLPLRRIKDIEYVGEKECQCILVDAEDHLYVTDDYIVTHNTYQTIYAGLKLLKQGKVDQLIYIRKAVESSDHGLGYMPGSLQDKVDLYMQPLEEKLEMFLTVSDIKLLKNSKKIHAAPINFLRGVDWQRKCIVLDEAQNLSYSEFKTFMTRIGEDCKVFILGDKMQSDIGNKSALPRILEMFSGEEHEQEGIFIQYLTEEDIVRSGICRHITKQFSRVDKLIRSKDN